MNRAEAYRLLPVAYAHALLLRDHGRDHAAIARALGIVAEAVGPLLRLAEAKLQQLLDTSPAGDDRLALLAASLDHSAEPAEPAEAPETGDLPETGGAAEIPEHPGAPGT